MLFGVKFNQLLLESELFDEKYCNNEALSIAPEHEVLEAHEAIIHGYLVLISDLPESKKREKANVYNNMHVQYEGLRKYYGICFDEMLESAKTEKRELLDKQYMCNAQCISYTILSRDTYSSKQDKKFEEDYLKEYKVVKNRLDAENRILVPQNSTSSEDSGVCFSEDEHRECAFILLSLATPKTSSAENSTALFNQCWRDLHYLAQSDVFKSHPQHTNLKEAVGLLTSIKIGLDDDPLVTENSHASSLLTQSFMAPSKSIGIKRTSRDEQQEEIEEGRMRTSSKKA